MKIEDASQGFGRAILAVAAICLTAGAASALPASERNTTYTHQTQVNPIVLFFEPGSSDIPSSAQAIANRALAQGVDEWHWHLRLDPYAPAEAGEKAETIAEERARNLVAFLVANGIPQWRVDAAPVQVTEVRDAAFQTAGERVEIHFRAGDAPVVAEMR